MDGAWQRLSSDWGTSVAELLTNVTALRAVMLYHLLPQSLSPSALRKTPVIHTYWKGHDVYGTFSGNDLMLVRNEESSRARCNHHRAHPSTVN